MSLFIARLLYYADCSQLFSECSLLVRISYFLKLAFLICGFLIITNCTFQGINYASIRTHLKRETYNLPNNIGSHVSKTLYRLGATINKTCQIRQVIIVIMKRKAESGTSKSATVQRNHWSAGLLKSMEDPECKIKEDDKIVVIKDKYPKAQFHYLILPKENIQSIWHVERNHQDLLMHMHYIACALVVKQSDHEFIMGYHTLPSMQRLHLHVISTDFNSPCLKTKYHWNSFTTPFFLHSSDVCRQLCEKGEVKKVSPEKSQVYLNRKLKCHKCSMKPKNMPALKMHLLTHVDSEK